MSTSSHRSSRSRHRRHEDKYSRHSSLEKSRHMPSHSHSRRYSSQRYDSHRSHHRRHKNNLSKTRTYSHRHHSRSRSRSYSRSTSRSSQKSVIKRQSNDLNNRCYHNVKHSYNSQSSETTTDTNKTCTHSHSDNKVSDNKCDNKPIATRYRKKWHEWEEIFIVSQLNKIKNDCGKTTKVNAADWKNIATKLENETRKRTNCKDLEGRSWNSVKQRFNRKISKNCIENDENDNNKVLKTEVEKNCILYRPLKIEYQSRNDSNNKDENEEMIDICNLLGISHLNVTINLYGFGTHLNVYEQILRLVKMDDENVRNNEINDLNSYKLRDIQSKIKSEGTCGRKQEMKDGIIKKLKQFKVNYDSNEANNLSDGSSDEPILGPLQTMRHRPHSGRQLQYDDDIYTDESHSDDSEHSADNENEKEHINENKKEDINDSENKNEKVDKEEILSLEFLCRQQMERGLRLVSNMRISDNEKLQNDYMVLLKKHMAALKKCTADLYQHQNIKMKQYPFV